MADSDNTTTLPSVTCGPEVGGLVVVRQEPEGDPGQHGFPNAAIDPAIALALAWMEAHAKVLDLCIRQQDREAELARLVGFPSSTLTLAGGNRTVSSIDELEMVLAGTPVDGRVSAKARKELSEQWARWQSADAALGYSVAKGAEDHAAAEQGLLLEQIAKTPARSVVGIVAKLSVILREAEDSGDPSDFPVPHIRSTLNDLQKLVEHKSVGSDPGRPASKPETDHAAWHALKAWCAGDDTGYRNWVTKFKASIGPQ